MNNIVIGRYVPRNTFLHKLDPRVKFILMIGLIFAVVTANDFYSLGVIGFFVIVFTLLSGTSFKKMLKTIKPFKFMFVFLLLINVLTLKQGTRIESIFGFDISMLDIWDLALYRTAGVLARIILMIYISTILTSTTRPIDLTIALEDIMRPLVFLGLAGATIYLSLFAVQLEETYKYAALGGGALITILLTWKIPVSVIATIIAIALRYIPTLLDEAMKIMKAQASRGVDFENGKFKEKVYAIITLIIPLFVSSLTKAGELADAMTSRGYVVGKSRTRFRQLKVTGRDFFASLMIILVISGVVFVSIEYPGRVF